MPRFSFYKWVPRIDVKALLWGTGFATHLGIVVADNANHRTPLHEVVHFIQIWVMFAIGFILSGNLVVAVLAFHAEYALELCIRRIIMGDWYKAYKSLFMERMASHIAGQKEWPLMAFYQPKNARWH